jgi:hypothetical protein
MRKKQGRVVAILLATALAVLLPLTAFADDAPQGADSTEAAVTQADTSQVLPASFADAQLLGASDSSGESEESEGVPPMLPPADPPRILSFTLAGQEGVMSPAENAIDAPGIAIHVTVPYGTDVSSLTPDIVHTWLITPEGPQDFTAPVIYTVFIDNPDNPFFRINYFVTVEVSTSVPVISAPDTWTGEGDATARLDAPYENFLQLTLNGAEVDPSNYTVSSGSTVIALHESYLKTLANGDYTFTALFTNGGSGNIFVKVGTQASGGGGTTTTGGAGTLPATGDTLSLGLAGLAALLLLLAVFAARQFRCSKGYQRRCRYHHSS